MNDFRKLHTKSWLTTAVIVTAINGYTALLLLFYSIIYFVTYNITSIIHVDIFLD